LPDRGPRDRGHRREVTLVGRPKRAYLGVRRRGTHTAHRLGVHSPARLPAPSPRGTRWSIGSLTDHDLSHGRLSATDHDNNCLMHLHSCSGCFRLERSPGGPPTHRKTPPSTAQHPSLTPSVHGSTNERVRDEQSLVMPRVRRRHGRCAPRYFTSRPSSPASRADPYNGAPPLSGARLRRASATLLIPARQKPAQRAGLALATNVGWNGDGGATVAHVWRFAPVAPSPRPLG
jgi:hypothetical protein